MNSNIKNAKIKVSNLRKMGVEDEEIVKVLENKGLTEEEIEVAMLPASKKKPVKAEEVYDEEDNDEDNGEDEVIETEREEIDPSELPFVVSKKKYGNGNETVEVSNISPDALRRYIDRGGNLNNENIMKLLNVDPDEFEVASFKLSRYEQQSKAEGLKELYALGVKFKKKASLTLDEFRKVVEDIGAPRKVKSFKLPVKYNDEDDVLEICVADPHIGLYADDVETEQNWNIAKSCAALRNGFEEVVERAKGHTYSKVVIATLGDIVHTNNAAGTTKKGTPQDFDGTYTKATRAAIDTLIDCIDRIADNIRVPIEVLYVPGNHDVESGALVMEAVSRAYRGSKQVTFDVDQKHRKARAFGVNMVGFMHGDCVRSEQTTWMHEGENRPIHGMTKYSEIHAGHLHSEQVKTVNGTTVRNLPACCGVSPWEYRNYGPDNGNRGISCFVWNKKVTMPRTSWFCSVNVEEDED